MVGTAARARLELRKQKMVLLNQEKDGRSGIFIGVFDGSFLRGVLQKRQVRDA